MSKLSGIAVIGAFFLLLSGCGSYRVLSEAKTGGTVALEGAHGSARSKAEQYMRAQCPDGYEIKEEGDVFSEGGALHEWRITYVCTGTSAPRTAMVAL
jgi:hypothetical protein